MTTRTHAQTGQSHEDSVLDLLRQRKRPLSAYDILDGVRGSKVRAAVQVYRALGKLEKQGLVHKVESLNAYVACACAHEKSAPGFMLCTCCGTVHEFDAAASLRAAHKLDKGFRIEIPNLELRGLCAICQRPGHHHGHHT